MKTFGRLSSRPITSPERRCESSKSEDSRPIIHPFSSGLKPLFIETREIHDKVFPSLFSSIHPRTPTTIPTILRIRFHSLFIDIWHHKVQGLHVRGQGLSILFSLIPRSSPPHRRWLEVPASILFSLIHIPYVTPQLAKEELFLFSFH